MASILVCDDQPDVVRALQLLLKTSGHRAAMADGPPAVRQALERERFDLVLTDMNFTRDTTSGREGLELVEEIRRRGAAPPVVVLTAWGDIDLAVQAMRRGAVDFVQKPWENARLLATVERCLEDARHAHDEMEIARSVQQKLLPERTVETRTLRAWARFEPAREVGGDYYDFFPLSEDELGVVLADVSGKGVPAALLMANLQALFRSQDAALLRQPAKLLTRINGLFYAATDAAHYATVFYACYDGAARQLRWANCGHPAARAGERECGSTAPPLGLFPEIDVEEMAMPFGPGERLYACSDGVLETDVAEDDRTELELVVTSLHSKA